MNDDLLAAREAAPMPEAPHDGLARRAVLVLRVVQAENDLG